jgi:hypothetical protein
MANGNVAPDSAIEGQSTHLSRTMHGIMFDEIHDEVIIPVALSGAVLVFKGDARGDTPPARIIQGPNTQLIRPQTVGIDPYNNEILAGDPSARAVLIFDRMANGDAKPKRVLGGPKTGFREIVGVAADGKRNLIVVATRSVGAESGLFIFDRTQNGDVAPIRKIMGPMTGALGRFRQVQVDAERGKIYLAVQSFRAQMPTPAKAADLYTNEAALKALRAAVANEEGEGGDEGGRGSKFDLHHRFLGAGFIGVWDINASGNVPPEMIIRGPSTRSTGFGGVAFNAQDGEVYGVGGGINGFLTYLVPQFFEKPGVTTTSSQAARQ